MSIAFFNGEYMALESVKISPLDRGFTFAESIYDVLPVYFGLLFEEDRHFARMQASAEGLGIALNVDTLREACAGVISENALEFGSLYVQVSGGVDPVRRHKANTSTEPTVLVFSQPAVSMPQRDCGVAAEVQGDKRWARCHLKTTNLAANTAALANSNAEEVIFERNGVVTEGASSNVFAVFGDEIITPTLNEFILPGITRALLLQELPQRQVKVKEASLSVAQLAAADEIFITSSTRELFPVVSLDGVPVGRGAVGPWYQLCRGVLQDYITRWLVQNDVQVEGSLLDFPCAFSLKAFGSDTDAFRQAVDAIVAQHVMPQFVSEAFDKPSSKGKFIARTVKLTAHSKYQLDQIYQALGAAEEVKMAL